MKAIKAHFKCLIEYTQGFTPNNLDDLFEEWYEAKKWFIQKMNGQLTIELGNIAFELSEETKMKKIDNFLDQVVDYFQNTDLARFILDQKLGFFKNTTISDYEFNGTVIPKGMKLLKAFKFFESDAKTLDKLQTLASMIIQENKIEGTLCFSVHPLDYLSISNNAHNWRSCHALDGEYRSGNLSYMLDSSTIICYLKSREDMEISHFPFKWNSKKWRMLLFFSDNHDALFAGKQYPCSCDEALNIIREKTIDVFLFDKKSDDDFWKIIYGRSRTWSHWHNDVLKHPGYKENNEDAEPFYIAYRVLERKIYAQYELIKHGRHSLMFDDLTSSSTYIPYYCWAEDVQHPITFSIGKQVPCLKCGESHLDITCSMQCGNCRSDYDCCDDNTITCECCGNSYHEDDIYWDEQLGCYLCEDCRDNQIVECANCHQRTFIQDSIWQRETGTNICVRCHYRSMQYPIELELEDDENLLPF